MVSVRMSVATFVNILEQNGILRMEKGEKEFEEKEEGNLSLSTPYCMLSFLCHR